MAKVRNNEIMEYMEWEGKDDGDYTGKAKVIWKAAYKRALKAGKSVKEAEDMADQAVREAGYYVEDGFKWRKANKNKRSGVA